jgi:hypothetical protein
VSAQGAGEYASPSALQTSRPVSEPDTQRAEPGLQMRGRHAPPEQLSVPAHATVE